MELDKKVLKETVERFMEKYKVGEEEARKSILAKGPKFLFSVEALLSPGWRAGFTKQTLEKRKKNRRIKNKKARKARRINRINSKK